MQKIIYYIEKYKIILLVSILLLILVFCFGFALNKNNNNEIVINDQEVNKEKNNEEIKDEDLQIFKVDIKGQVENPNVYEMDSNSRIIDVINKAGGLKEDANTEYINLSKKIKDEMIIIIYSNSDIEEYKVEDKTVDNKIEDNKTVYIQYECICPDNMNDGCITNEDIINTYDDSKNELDNKDDECIINNNITHESNKITDDLISINSNEINELIKLNGIGEGKAKAIIDYRKENGDFKKLEDIMKVSGIGEAAYSKIKDNIKL